MGTWGTGIFDSDEAQDYLGNLVDSIAQPIRDCFGSPHDNARRKDLDVVVAALACLRAIATTIDDCKYSLQRSEVDGWRETYLDWYDREAVNAWTSREDAIKHREQVENEFQTLSAQLDQN